MRQFTAFTKKELLQLIRNGRLIILAVMFILMGIMNPAIAKLTPWLLDFMADDITDSGLVLAQVIVNAMTSWAQFFKNLPIALIIYILMFGSGLTDELSGGTLINVLTKGLKRPIIIISKMGIAILLWITGFLICFGITYGYNAYFWDNSIADNLLLSAFASCLMGIWLISVIYPASALFNSFPAVILTVGGSFGCSYLLGMIAAVKKYVPAYLADSGNMLSGKTNTDTYIAAIIITAILIIFNIISSVVIFNRKQV